MGTLNRSNISQILAVFCLFESGVTFLVSRLFFDSVPISAALTLDSFDVLRKEMESLSEEETIMQKKKISFFFKKIRNSLIKHFTMWISGNVFFLSIFCDQPMASVFAKKILHNNYNVSDVTFHSEYHKDTIHLPALKTFIDDNISDDTMEITRQLPAIKDYLPMVRMIAHGSDIWSTNVTSYMASYRDLFLENFSSFPTNNHNVERGVRESGFVTLGNRSESNRSIYVVARGGVIPEGLELGKETVNNHEKKIQGKKRHCFLYDALNNHNMKLRAAKTEEPIEFDRLVKRYRKELSDAECQFQTERLNKKFEAVMQTIHDDLPAPNVWEQRTGITYTGLVLGKVQYGKLRKKDHTDALREELTARGIDSVGMKWTDMIRVLKHDEGDEDVKFFKPRNETTANLFVMGDE